MLIVMEHRDLHSLAQLLFDDEALGRLDVFEIDAAEGGLQAGDDVHQLVGIALVDLDVEYINTREFLEQHRLAFHDGLGGERTNGAEAQHCGAVGDHRDQVAARREVAGLRGVRHDLLAGDGHAGRVGQRQVALVKQTLRRGDGDLAGRGQPMVIERRLSKWVVHKGGELNFSCREPVRPRIPTVMWIIPHGFRRAFFRGLRTGVAMLAALLCIAPALPGTAHAQGDAARAAESVTPLPFRVEIDAPRELQAQLQKGLDLMRWQHDPHMTTDALQRLVAEARSETERAAAAEGYFSAKVSTAISQEGAGAVVRIVVEPGPRTTIASIDIQFTGTIADGSADNNQRIDAARRAWRMPAGQPFRQVEWEAA